MFAMTCRLLLAAFGLSALTSANKMPEPVGSVSSSLIQSQSTVAESKQPGKLALPDSTAKPHDDKTAEKKHDEEAEHKTDKSDDHAPSGDGAEEGKENKLAPAQHTSSKDGKDSGNSKHIVTNGSSASHEGANDSDRKEALHHVEKAMKEVKSKEMQSVKAIKDARATQEAAQKATSKVLQAKKQATKAEAKLHDAEKQLHDQVEAGQKKSQAASQCSLWLGTVACGLGAVMLVQ